MLRMKVSSLRVMGRNTQGVRLINLEKKNDEIASVCKVQSQPESEETDLATNQGESLDNSSEEIQNDNTTNEQQDNK